ncbi:hypothetical protein ACLOJK_033495 [Asimina triloba]
MAPKKVGHLTLYGEVKVGHPSQTQRKERSPPHNAVVARPLYVVDAPPPEDRVLSNSSDPSGESPKSPVTRAGFHALLEMIKSLQQQMVHAQPDIASVPSTASAGIPSPLAATVQPIPDGFQIPKLVIFGPASNPVGQMVNYNIHMDLHTSSKGLKCRAFPATLDEQGKMWFTFLAPDSIASFRQFIDLFEAQFNNQWQRLVTAA